MKTFACRPLVAALLAGTAVSVAHAAPTSDDAIVRANNHVALQLGVGALNYAEDAPAADHVGTLDAEHGPTPALRLDWSRQGPVLGLPDVYTAVSETMLVGPMFYRGYSFGANDPSTLGPIANQRHTSLMSDTQFRLGKAFRIAPRFQITPYLAYTFHDWVRFSNENYLHHEVGAGVLGQVALTPRTVVGLDVTLGRTLGPVTMASGLSNEHLGSRMTEQVALTGDYALTPALHLLASYQLHHFSYGQSSTRPGHFAGLYSDAWYEPSSRTTEQLFLVGLSLNF